MADLNRRLQDTINAKILRDTEATGLPLTSSRIPDPLLPDNHLRFHSIYGQRHVLTKYPTIRTIFGRFLHLGDLIFACAYVLCRPHLSRPRPPPHKSPWWRVSSASEFVSCQPENRVTLVSLGSISERFLVPLTTGMGRLHRGICISLFLIVGVSWAGCRGTSTSRQTPVRCPSEKPTQWVTR